MYKLSKWNIPFSEISVCIYLNHVLVHRLLSRCGNSLDLPSLETYFVPLIFMNTLHAINLTIPPYQFPDITSDIYVFTQLTCL